VAEVEEEVDVQTAKDVKFRSVAQAAREMLITKHMDVPKLTSKEVSSLLVTFYAVTEKLEMEMEKNTKCVAHLGQESEARQGSMCN
jgi:hypothetical protein